MTTVKYIFENTSKTCVTHFMGVSQQTLLLDEPREVDVSTIEQELVQLWKNASEGTEADAAKPVVRACSLNLIVFSEDPSRVDEVAALVDEVTIEHPGRAFLVSAVRRSGSSSLHAWVSARCSVPAPGGKQVCCEQINLEVSGMECARVPSIIRSLLVSDVPTFLLWKGPVDSHDAVLQALVEVSDRALIDSSADLHPEATFRAWNGFIRKNGGHTVFGDLAWSQLTPWRSLVANAFQPPEMREHLTRIHSLTIEYSTTVAPHHSGFSQALLAVGWLASRLEWTPLHPLTEKGIREYETKLRLGEQAISVELVPVDPKGKAGGIQAISIRALPALDTTFTRAGDSGCVRFERSLDGSHMEDLLAMNLDSTVSVQVARELEILQRGKSYEDALASVTGLLRRSK